MAKGREMVARRVRVLVLNVRRKGSLFVMVDWVRLAIRRSRRMLVYAVMSATGGTTCSASLSHLRNLMLFVSISSSGFVHYGISSFAKVATGTSHAHIFTV